MYELKDDTEVLYEFTPAWFTDAVVKELIIKWNKDEVTKTDSTSTDGNYLAWSKTNLSKGEKVTATVEYNPESFTALDANKTASNSKTTSSSNGVDAVICFFVICFYIIFIVIIAFVIGGGYYGHRGFYGGFHGGVGRGGGCAHSSCASSCACACAGSGRAGCSKKDFYGTNLTSNKIKKVIK